MGISSGKGPKVAVLMGGRSLEREVSLISGEVDTGKLNQAGTLILNMALLPL